MKNGSTASVAAALILLLVVGPALALGAMILALLLIAQSAGTSTSYSTSESQCQVLTGGQVAGLSAEQMGNARTIVTRVMERDLSVADAVITVMTAMTESSLINVAHGDAVGPDSRGFFQQRDSWGPLEVRMDPVGATDLFLNALTSPELKVYRTSTKVNASGSSRATVEPWLVAQSVQRSAYADGSNYKGNYANAVAVVREILPLQADQLAVPWRPPLTVDNGVGNTLPAPGVAELMCGESDGGAASTISADGPAAVESAIDVALRQVGDPYVWGATGPDSFDCSGLVLYSYTNAGVKGVPRVSRDQAAGTKHYSLEEMRRGDLLFWARGGRVYHVAIYLGEQDGKKMMVEAPRPGLGVQVVPVRSDNLEPYVGRVVEG